MWRSPFDCGSFRRVFYDTNRFPFCLSMRLSFLSLPLNMELGDGIGDHIFCASLKFACSECSKQPKQSVWPPWIPSKRRRLLRPGARSAHWPKVFVVERKPLREMQIRGCSISKLGCGGVCWGQSGCTKCCTEKDSRMDWPHTEAHRVISVLGMPRESH
jgi:hypothetical protein